MCSWVTLDAITEWFRLLGMVEVRIATCCGKCPCVIAPNTFPLHPYPYFKCAFFEAVNTRIRLKPKWMSPNSHSPSVWVR